MMTLPLLALAVSVLHAICTMIEVHNETRERLNYDKYN